MKRSKRQNARFYSLISALNIDKELKDLLVYQYTSGRTTRSSDMEYGEMRLLLKELTEDLLTNQKNDNKANKLRRKIISLFREMDYHTEAGKADMTRIKATCLKVWKKDFNEYNTEELSRIIAVLQRDWVPHYYTTKIKS